MTGVVLLCEKLFEVDTKKRNIEEKSQNFNLLQIFLEYFEKKIIK